MVKIEMDMKFCLVFIQKSRIFRKIIIFGTIRESTISSVMSKEVQYFRLSGSNI